MNLEVFSPPISAGLIAERVSRAERAVKQASRPRDAKANRSWTSEDRWHSPHTRLRW